LKRHLSALLFGVMATLGAARPALAEQVDDKTRNAARSLAEQGRSAFDKGDFARAQDLFHRAYGLVAAPTIALYEARSLAKLARLVQAQEAYLRAVRTKLTADSPEPFRKAVRDAELEEISLEPRIPKVTIAVTGPGARTPKLRVTADGEALEPELIGVEMPINPGPHALVASAPGVEPSRVNFTIEEGAAKRVEIEVAAPVAVSTPALPPSNRRPVIQPFTHKDVRTAGTWQKPAAYAAGAVGAAGLVTGIVTGAMAGSRYSRAEQACPNHVCIEGTSGADDLNAFRSLRSVSTVAYIVGGVGLATGVALFVLAPSEKSPASAALWLGPSDVSVRGTF